MSKPEIYVSTDVETDGPIPGPHSMLSFGSAAYTKDGKLVDTFSVNLECLEGATGHPDTMAWWKTQPEAWEACRANLVAPEVAMPKYQGWLNSLPGKPVFVGYPAGFDFLFVYWYLIRFTGSSPFSFSALDIKSFAMAELKADFRMTTKKRMPKRWFGKRRHTHVSLDDAIEQGELFCNMLRENRSPLKPGWKIPDSVTCPECGKVTSDFWAYNDGGFWSWGASCACGQDHIEMNWPFKEDYVDADEWRKLGFEVV